MSDVTGWIELLQALGKSRWLKRLSLEDVRYAERVFSAFPWAQLGAFNYIIRHRGDRERLDYPNHFNPDRILLSPSQLEVFETSIYMRRKSLTTGSTGSDFPFGS